MDINLSKNKNTYNEILIKDKTCSMSAPFAPVAPPLSITEFTNLLIAFALFIFIFDLPSDTNNSYGS